MNRLPQVGDTITLKEGIGLGDLRGKKFKVVWVDKKRNAENREWFEVGCVGDGRRFCVTESDIASLTEGQEKVSFT